MNVVAHRSEPAPEPGAETDGRAEAAAHAAAHDSPNTIRGRGDTSTDGPAHSERLRHVDADDAIMAPKGARHVPGAGPGQITVGLRPRPGRRHLLF